MRISKEAKQLVSDYERLSGWKGTPATLRYCQRRLKNGEGDAMRLAFERYAAELAEQGWVDKQYILRTWNWFGREDKYMTKLPVERAEPVVIEAAAPDSAAPDFWATYRVALAGFRYDVEAEHPEWGPSQIDGEAKRRMIQQRKTTA